VEELAFLTATEQADLVRRGEVAPRELFDVYLERIERLDPELNAFVTVCEPSEPRDGPFRGVPLPIKDLNETAGVRTTYSSRPYADFVPDFDSAVVRRLKDAGFVVLGKTNTPELGITAVTESELNGACRNPWDVSRTPGGSSGGAGAAVAAGLAPAAQGSDGGGSIRIPCSCCGIYGIKPARGRVSPAPYGGLEGFSLNGPMTRSVLDAAALLDVLAGYETGDVWWAPPPERPFAEEVGRDPGRLRIAITTSPPIEGPVASECVAAAESTAALLEELGHEVVRADPPWRGEGLLEAFAALFGPAVASQIAAAGMLAGREPRAEDMESLSWWVFERARSLDAVSAGLAAVRMQRLARSVVTWAQPYDAILCPTLAEAPVAAGTIDPSGPEPSATFARGAAFTPFTAISNVTGSPAISLPLAVHPDGLPLGVQLVGRPAGEGPLLALAAQLEAARPWSGRRVQSASPKQTGVENRPWPT